MGLTLDQLGIFRFPDESAVNGVDQNILCSDLDILYPLRCDAQMCFAPGFSDPDKYRWDSRLFDGGIV
jgi:hypothetical protein